MVAAVLSLFAPAAGRSIVVGAYYPAPPTTHHCNKPGVTIRCTADSSPPQAPPVCAGQKEKREGRANTAADERRWVF